MDKQDKKDTLEKLSLFINKIEGMCEFLCESDEDEVIVVSALGRVASHYFYKLSLFLGKEAVGESVLNDWIETLKKQYALDTAEDVEA